MECDKEVIERLFSTQILYVGIADAYQESYKKCEVLKYAKGMREKLSKKFSSSSSSGDAKSSTMPKNNLDQDM